MIPSRREAHSSLFLHHLPAVQHEPATLGSLGASIITAGGRAVRDRRGRGGQVERERAWHVPSSGFALWWQCSLPHTFIMLLKHHKLATEYPSIHPSICLFPMHSFRFIEIDVLPPKEGEPSTSGSNWNTPYGDWSFHCLNIPKHLFTSSHSRHLLFDCVLFPSIRLSGENAASGRFFSINTETGDFCIQ